MYIDRTHLRLHILRTTDNAIALLISYTHSQSHWPLLLLPVQFNSAPLYGNHVLLDALEISLYLQTKTHYQLIDKRKGTITKFSHVPIFYLTELFKLLPPQAMQEAKHDLHACLGLLLLHFPFLLFEKRQEAFQFSNWQFATLSN